MPVEIRTGENLVEWTLHFLARTLRLDHGMGEEEVYEFLARRRERLGRLTEVELASMLLTELPDDEYRGRH